MSKEIKLTQGKVAIVDDEKFEFLNQWKWYAIFIKVRWYATRTSATKEGRKQLYMHRIIMNPPPNLETDHIDHDGLNNRKTNLRLVTRSQNNQNRMKRKNKSSQYKGVRWYPNTEKWKAEIQINGHQIHLGYFITEHEAALVYNEKAKELFGVFANLNFMEG